MQNDAAMFLVQGVSENMSLISVKTRFFGVRMQKEVDMFLVQGVSENISFVSIKANCIKH